MREIPIIEWCDLLLKLHESGKINDYMKTTNIYENYQKIKKTFGINGINIKKKECQTF